LVIEKGLITQTENSTSAFENILNIIRSNDGEVQIRELGFGLNRALTRDKVVSDIGTYERMCGVHLSLGKKHDSYVKPGFKRGESRFHIDVFLAVESVNINGEVIYKDNSWCVSTSTPNHS
jgi:aminopeptidase